MNKRKRVNDVLLLIYPFSVVFEYWNPLFLPDNYTVSFVIGFLYMLTSILYLEKRFNIIVKEKWISYLIAYIFLEVILSIINFKYVEGINDILNRAVLLNFLFLFLAYSHLTEKPTLLRLVIISYVLAAGLMGTLNFFGIGQELVKGRLESFGEDANTVANKAFFGLMGAIFVLRNKRSYGYSSLITVLIAISAVTSMYVLFSTGSRGPFLTLVIILIFLFLISKIHYVIKIIVSIALLSSITLITNYIFDSELVLVERLLLTIEYGQTGRNDIWAAAYKAILDNPQGVGRSGILPTMHAYLGSPMGTHNIFLWVTLTSGFLGLLFFLLFQKVLFYRSYYAYKNGDIQFLIYFISITLISSQAGGIINKKFLWFIYLLILLSSLSVKSNIKKNENFDNIR